VTDYFESFAISHRTALHAVSSVLEEGERKGLSFVVTVVDPSLRLVAFCRADRSNPLAVESTRRAASTALVDDRASGWMPPEAAVVLALASANSTTNVPGGLPIRFGGQLVGALAVGGEHPDENSAAARVALESIGADAVPV
jgi:glc operon protein GlcG